MQIKKDRIYVESEKLLFIIDIQVVDNVIIDDKIIPIDDLRTITRKRINFNKYNFVRVSHSTLDDPEVLRAIAASNPEMNSDVALEKDEIIVKVPPKPLLAYKHYITVDPGRLMLMQPNLIYGFRNISKSKEWTINAYYSPISILLKLKTLFITNMDYKHGGLTSSYRSYYKNTCRGVYLGIGASIHYLSMDYSNARLFLYFDISENEEDLFLLAGPYLEIGYTGHIYKRINSSFNVGVTLGKLVAHSQGTQEWDVWDGLVPLPTISYSIGMLF